jgi:hypothetical protein
MAKKTNGNTIAHNGHVSLTREEYNAFLSLEALNAGIVDQQRQTAIRNHDLNITCNAQARRLTEIDLIMQHYERVNGLQQTYIDMLHAGYPKVAALEDLSEFWRQWVISTENNMKERREQRETIAVLEPDLFRTWKVWVNNFNTNRSISVSGTRKEVEAQQPATQVDLQNQIVKQLNDKNAQLASQVQELQDQIENMRKRNQGRKT